MASSRREDLHKEENRGAGTGRLDRVCSNKALNFYSLAFSSHFNVILTPFRATGQICEAAFPI